MVCVGARYFDASQTAFNPVPTPTNPSIVTGSNQDNTHPETASSSKKSGSSTSNNSIKTERDYSSAPRQQMIRNKVAVEYEYRALLTANDPGYSSSWILQKVNAPAAWNISTGNNQTVVADIDSGFALNHEDLAANWRTNSREQGTTTSGDRCWTGTPQNKQSNNCDDDNNGYVDDWRGWNFTNATNNPQAGQTNVSGGGVAHGTETAGLIGAVGNNGKGIATINWSTKIMPLQALDDSGTGYTSDITAAIYYAVDNGANVINMSLGGSQFDQALDDAITYAYQHGVVVVAAAGNCGTGAESGCDPSKPGAMSYPALDNHVIAVGATTQTDARASFSSYGAGLDVVAPGAGTITSTGWTSGNATTLYATNLNGTSFASPQVASLAALIKSIRPSTSVDDVTALILGTATKISGLGGQFYSAEYGHGLVNAFAALTVAQSLNSTASNTPILLQTGGPNSEHNLLGANTTGSGCTTLGSTYCSIWLKDARTGFDRYLPYSLTNVSGQAGWTWSAAVIGSGSWSVRAVQGQAVSTTPYLMNGK